MPNTERTPSANSWYAIHTHPRQEERVYSNLQAWNEESFLPRMRECRYNQFTGKPSYVIKPLFPGYLFVRINIEEAYHKLRYTRGVHSLVSFGSSPAPVDDEVISTIKARIVNEGFVLMSEEPATGLEVKIKEGVLKDFTGVFERNKSGSDRVTILLHTVSCQPQTIRA